MQFQITIIGALLLTGCGRETTPTGYKLAGVGGNPEEIAAVPTEYSGLISYDWIELSGAALPLELLGLGAIDGVAPDSGMPFQPPYAVVSSSALIMDGNFPATDVLFGNLGVAPTAEGRCHTIYEPASHVSGLADVGSAISIQNADGSAGVELGRRPLAYPPDVQDISPSYHSVEPYRSVDRTHRIATDGLVQELSEMELGVLSQKNFPFGEQMYVSFPGALPPAEATFSSIPVPLQDSDVPHVLPTRPSGVMMTWSGPQYSSDGVEVASGQVSTCMQFVPHDSVPTSAAECVGYQELGELKSADELPRGQMYTPPWETDVGITFEWIVPESTADEVVSITVRFLGPVNEKDSRLTDAVVRVPPTQEARAAWSTAQSQGHIPPGASIPDGHREARVCEEPGDFTYQLDETLMQGNGYVPSLQGSPSRTMAEVVCNVGDTPSGSISLDGTEYTLASFTLSGDMMADALAYGRQQGAMGAVFYFNRTTKQPLELPAVRDYVGNRRNTESVMIVSNAAQLGRFWIGQDGL